MRNFLRDVWLELDRRALIISILGGFCICFAYLVMNASIYIGEETATKLYFLFLAIGLIFLSFPTRKKHWFLMTFFELCLYNLLDEILGRACIIDYWEVLGAIFLLVYNWKTWKV